MPEKQKLWRGVGPPSPSQPSPARKGQSGRGHDGAFDNGFNDAFTAMDQGRNTSRNHNHRNMQYAVNKGTTASSTEPVDAIDAIFAQAFAAQQGEKAVNGQDENATSNDPRDEVDAMFAQAFAQQEKSNNAEGQVTHMGTQTQPSELERSASDEDDVEGTGKSAKILL